MKIMNNIKWESVNCHICKKHNIEPLNIVNGQFGFAVHPVICKTCGLVYLSPRWDKATYDTFYNIFYDKLYELSSRPDIGVSGIEKNYEAIYNRIEPHVVDNIKILDVGCSDGTGIRYIGEKAKNSDLFGIDPTWCIPGVEMIATDFDSDWTTGRKGQFNIIILRHVLEHSLDPVSLLKKIEYVLSDFGFAYIAVPDMMHPRMKLRDYDDWREYWFRAVHPYYYCRETLINTLGLTTLYPLEIGEVDEEVWCVVTKNDTPSVKNKFKSVYENQKSLLKNLKVM